MEHQTFPFSDVKCHCISEKVRKANHRLLSKAVGGTQPVSSVGNFCSVCPSQIMLLLRCTSVEQFILREHGLPLQAHMFALEIKLLMAKCIHCSWVHQLMVAGTIVFSKCWWLFLCTGHWPVSHIHSCVPALHLEKEKGKDHLWLVCEQELAYSPLLCLRSES